MDPLSAIFSSMSVQQALVDRLEVTAPWGFHSTSGPEIRFILMLRGSAVLETKSLSQPLSLRGGDLFILFGGDYSLANEASSQRVHCEALVFTRIGSVIQFGGGGVPTTLAAGRFVIDQVKAGPILKVLPASIHLQLDQKRTHSFQSVMELISLETEHPGLASEEMINRLCEMLFIHAIRAYTQDLTQNQGGWLAGISDGQLGQVIQLLHAHLHKNWTVDSMAASAGMSRSAFAARFKLIVGQSPLEYLTQWRIHRASVLIRKTDSNIGKIAKGVGYASESAFTKVFKKVMQTTPSEFRRAATEG
ncbi:AraC family transcriptional regulator [Granulicella arctica]|uniref:AraC family transcriptional regulator n=1 Tax=Granulicella arctica TaxID=940613 RepID=UPI0021E0F1BE|nr:AraC family transcriptional regulator [Granulicella arctica]